MLWRLFHEDGVRVFQPNAVGIGCRCSREKIQNVLLSFPREEIDDMALEEGRIEVRCEFCNTPYDFDSGALNALRPSDEA
jgi:molecular chaperone Hsp33